MFFSHYLYYHVSKERIQLLFQCNLGDTELLGKMVSERPPHSSVCTLPFYVSFLKHQGHIHNFSLSQMLVLELAGVQVIIWQKAFVFVCWFVFCLKTSSGPESRLVAVSQVRLASSQQVHSQSAKQQESHHLL